MCISRVDLCHQGNEEDDEDEEFNNQDPLLEKRFDKPSTMSTDGQRRWFGFRHVRSRQKIVVIVSKQWKLYSSCVSLSSIISLMMCSN